MLNDEAAPLVIDITKDFISLIMGIEPRWQKAYLRFSLRDSISDIKASYEYASGVEIIDVVKHKSFFHPAARKSLELLARLEKLEGVFLLTVDSNFNYDIKFEYHNLDVWAITKMNGGSGVPNGSISQ